MKHYVTICFHLLLVLQIFGQQPKWQKPNIIIILADDLGYHDVSYYGTEYVHTPNIDLLCKSGMRFDKFYANSPVCSPTRASLMSGRYPEMVGVPGLVRSTPESNFGFLKAGARLLPRQLKKANYKTAIIGKWNLGLESPNLPNEKGFDFFHGFLDDMMENYYTHIRNGRNFMRENFKEINPAGHATDIFTTWATGYIKDQKNSKDPFFLYLAYNAPHFPVEPPADWLAKVKARQPELSEKRTKLIALIEHMDDGIGKVIRSLKETGQYENTLIIFLSDNGGNLEVGSNNGDLKDGKQSMYEGGLRVPAVFVWPNHIKPGSVNTERITTMDIYPTLSELAGTRINHKIDGTSFLSILKNPEAKLADRLLFFTRREGGLRYGGQTIQAVISGEWKLLQNSPYAPYELYNLQNDPAEQHDLSKSETDQFKRLHALLTIQMQKGGSVPWQQPETP
ncbi:MAG: sulfatase-like hydrolase/transferase [Chitinophagaceae bacterium]